MKHFPILQGRAYVADLPEGATDPKIVDGILYYRDDIGTDGISLPPGTWQIVGLLPEITEEQAAGVVEYTGVWLPLLGQYVCYMNYVTHGDCKTAIESLESAILAEGYTFTPSLTEIYDRESECMSVVESRVLSRERTLILRRVGL